MSRRFLIDAEGGELNNLRRLTHPKPKSIHPAILIGMPSKLGSKLV